MSGALMWPRPLPRQIREDPLRSSEVRVYDLLAKQLGPEWTVYYSRPYLKMTPSGEELDGEADFVVVHPVRGVLALEVKGGEITRDPVKDQWKSRDRDGVVHKIKNPVKQAVSAQHTLFDKVRVLPSWPKGVFVRLRHGVVFPSANAPPRDLGPDMPREIFCCRDELPQLGEWVKQRLADGNEGPMGEAGMKAFEDLLSLAFTLRVPLASHLDDDENAIASLTPQQFYILDAVSHLPRVAAGGGAGTGKTIVACEDAARLSANGKKTLLLCLGDLLAEHLRGRMKDSGVQVMTFAELCRDYAVRTGLRTSLEDQHALDEGPDLLIKAVTRDPSLRLDAIVVDEAQDFRSQWWIALEDILKDPKKSSLHAFYDTNQSVYGDLTGELASFSVVPIRLTRNLRNTKVIHSAATRFYEGNVIVADGPDGFPVTWIESTSSTMDRLSVDAVRDLTEEGEVNPADIAILATSEKMILLMRQRLAAYEGISIAHVREFKGLERKVVILLATRDLSDERELAYVALSRPRAHLTVIGETDIIEWLRGQRATEAG
ncbi:AAA family ATPase [Devosia sp.]|uniref:AAA family ATPase n=1 Tax=Devosia sp. TaxID=1871048 RepID=UPI00292E73BA|nr:AAA family ATPase [Devosia sp.]